jgi:hypothetical protein
MSAGWLSAVGAEQNVETAPQPFTRCVIWINPAVWGTEKYEGFTAWPEFAIDIVHEVGHLLGRPDLFAPEDTGSIMYVEPSAEIQVTGEYAPGWR